MLVLSRKRGEKIIINDDVVLTVVEIRRDSIRLGVEAPREIIVNREEIVASDDRKRRRTSGEGPVP